MTTPALEQLERDLAHNADFVRRVVRRLVIENDVVDDIVQETWLAALKARPRRRGLKSWLARVARNFAFRMSRDEMRRLEREKRAARPVGIAGQEHYVRRLLDDVMALDEIYRRPLLMRYYDGLEPRAIARELDIPDATVRTRLRRGLERLRQRLDHESGGDRSAWCLALLPWALPPLGVACGASAAAAGSVGVHAARSALTHGGVIVTKKTVFAGVAALAAVASIAVVSLWSGDDDRDITSGGRDPAAVETADADDVRRRVEETGGENPDEAVGPAEEAPGPQIAESAATRRLALLRGRAVDENGRALAGADVRLTFHNDLDEQSPVIDGNLSPPSRSATTDAAGRFRFADVPAHWDLSVRARTPDLCDAVTRIGLDMEGDRDLGDLVLRAGGAVSGRVLGPDGAPVTGAEVSVHESAQKRVPASNTIVFNAFGSGDPRETTTDASGAFVVRGLADGEWYLEARAKGLMPAYRKGLHVKDRSEVRDVEVKLAAGRVLAGKVRTPEGTPVEGAMVTLGAANIELTSATETRRLSGKGTRTAADGSYRFAGLPDRAFNVTVRRDGFLDATRLDVEPSEGVDVMVERCALLVGRVHDAQTGEPVDDFEVKAAPWGRYGDSPGSGSVHRGAKAAALAGVDDARGLYVISNVPDRVVSVDVRAKGYADRRKHEVSMVPGGRVNLDFRLDPEHVLRGRVVDPDGAPVAGAEVLVSPPEAVVDDVEAGAGVRRRYRVARRGDDDDEPLRMPRHRRVETDASGLFVVDGLDRGRYLVQARGEPWAHSDRLELAATTDPEVRHELRLQAGGLVRGTARTARGEPMAGARVQLRTEEAAARAEDPMNPAGRGRNVVTDPEGRFEFRAVAPGAYRVSLAEEEKRGGGAVVMFRTNEPVKPEGVAVEVKAGAVAEVTLEAPPICVLAGTITAGGAPAAGVRVTVQPRSARIPVGGPETGTDRWGDYAFENLRAGEYTVTIRHPKSPIPVEREIDLEDHQNVILDVELPSGSISGRVLDATGKPLAGVTVRAGKAQPDGAAPRPQAMMIMMTGGSGGGVQSMTVGAGTSSIKTGADGRYTLQFVDEGEYDVTIEGQGVIKSTKKAVAVAEDRATRGVDFAAEKGFSLEVSAEGATLVMITLTPEEGGEPMRKPGTGAAVRFDGLRAGRYEVAARPIGPGAGGEEVRKTVTVGKGGDEKVRLRL